MPRPVQEIERAQRLSRAYGLKGKLGLQLDEVIVPVHIVGKFPDQGGVQFADSAIDDAVVGQVSSVLLENQVGSGVLAELEWIMPFGTGADFDATIRYVPRGLIDSIPFDAAEQGQSRDLRLSPSGAQGRIRGACVVGTRTAVGGGDLVHGFEYMPTFNASADTLPPPFPFRVVMPPGTRVALVGGDDNIGFGCAFGWSETPLQASELLTG